MRGLLFLINLKFKVFSLFINNLGVFVFTDIKGEGNYHVAMLR